jgi:hypothetical protein
MYLFLTEDILEWLPSDCDGSAKHQYIGKRVDFRDVTPGKTLHNVFDLAVDTKSKQQADMEASNKQYALYSFESNH